MSDNDTPEAQAGGWTRSHKKPPPHHRIPYGLFTPNSVKLRHVGKSGRWVLSALYIHDNRTPWGTVVVSDGSLELVTLMSRSTIAGALAELEAEGLTRYHPEYGMVELRDYFSPKTSWNESEQVSFFSRTLPKITSPKIQIECLELIDSCLRSCTDLQLKNAYLAGLTDAYGSCDMGVCRAYAGREPSYLPGVRRAYICSSVLLSVNQLPLPPHPPSVDSAKREGGGEDIPTGYKSQKHEDPHTCEGSPQDMPTAPNTPADQTPIPTPSIPPKPSKDIPASADQVQTPTPIIPPNQVQAPPPTSTQIAPLTQDEKDTLRRLDSALTSRGTTDLVTGPLRPDSRPAYPPATILALRAACFAHPATLINIRAAAAEIESGAKDPVSLLGILGEIAPLTPAPRKTKADSRRSHQGNSGRTPTPAPPTAQDSSDASQGHELAGLWSQLTLTHGCPKNKYSRTRDLQALAQALADGVTPDQVLIRWSARVGEWAGRCADAKYLPTLSAWITDKGGHLIALDEESAAPHRDTPTPAAPLTPDQEAAAAKAMAGLTFNFPAQPQETPQ